jgi:phosphate butyryltransferase
MIYTSLQQLADRVRDKKGAKTKTSAVIAADDEHTLEAAAQAARDGIANPLLVGQAQNIKDKLAALGEDPKDYEIIQADSPEDCALKAALAVRDHRADFLVKGLINTNVMLKVLFGEAAGFRGAGNISHLSVAQAPSYHKLLGVTDAAINVRPNLEQKRSMIENAVRAMRLMGFDAPKVAVLASTELVNPKMPETLDAQALKEMNRQGLITDCLVEGPISFDVAFSKEAAQIKRLDNPVCGDADLMVCPDIVSANILLKCLRYAGGARTAGIVVGGRAPLVLTSRAVEAQDKYWPMILAASACR